MESYRCPRCGCSQLIVVGNVIHAEHVFRGNPDDTPDDSSQKCRKCGLELTHNFEYAA